MKHLRCTSVLFSLILLGACSNVENPTRPTTSASAASEPGAAGAAAATLTATSESAEASGDHAPGAPTSLVATVRFTHVTLEWQAPATGTVAHYLLEMGYGPGQTFGTLPRDVHQGTSISFNYLAGRYYVRVRAVAPDGARSAPSNEVEVVLAQCEIPGPPDFRATVSGNIVTLTWREPIAPEGIRFQSYGLQVGTGGCGNNVFSGLVGNVTSVSSSLPPGPYCAIVAARLPTPACGMLWSNEVRFTIGPGAPGPCTGPPAAPASLTGAPSGSTVTLSWLPVAGALSYVIEAGTSAGASNVATLDTASTATSFTAPGLPAGTYDIRIRARNACGTSATSNEVVLTVGGGPPPPPPPGASLSGLWRGTVTTVEPSRTRVEPIEVDFTHSGTRLTGVAARDGRRLGTFDLTQNAGNPARYDGTLFVPVDVAGCENRQGSLTAQGTTRLSGTFTVQCGTNTFDITKVQ